MKRGSAQGWGAVSIRRHWLSQLCLILYVLAVHGMPALHLAWHQSDHVHELGGLRWIHPRLPAHVHLGSTPHHAATPEQPSETEPRTSQASTRLVASTTDPAVAPHLALGAAHGQQSLLSPVLRLSHAVVQPAGLLVAEPLPPSLRDLSAQPRARAPPASV